MLIFQTDHTTGCTIDDNDEAGAEARPTGARRTTSAASTATSPSGAGAYINE